MLQIPRNVANKPLHSKDAGSTVQTRDSRPKRFKYHVNKFQNLAHIVQIKCFSCTKCSKVQFLKFFPVWRLGVNLKYFFQLSVFPGSTRKDLPIDPNSNVKNKVYKWKFWSTSGFCIILWISLGFQHFSAPGNLRWSTACREDRFLLLPFSDLLNAENSWLQAALEFLRLRVTWHRLGM